jgi:hypothetical protein
MSDKKKEENTVMIGAIIGSVLLFLGVGGFGYFYWSRSKESKRLK